jgi:hypothetical protein
MVSFKVQLRQPSVYLPKIFGYDMVFVAIDKTTHQIGIFDCSPQFIERGKEKVERAIEAYKLFYDNPEF